MPKKILLADDSITIQKVVELTFSDGDYEVTAVNNGAKAVQKLAEMRPDIILSDIIMPEKNGYEVCEYVKSHPEYRNIPVVLLTGTFEPFDPDRAEKAGCDAVVTKPFESQSLIHKVEELIAQAQANSAAAAPAEITAETSSPWMDDAPATTESSFSSPAGFGGFPSAAPEPFTHDADIFGAAPAPDATTEMPFEIPPTPSYGTAAFADVPAFGDPADTPFGGEPEGEAFGGETRAFPRMTFEEMQRMASASAAEPTAAPAAAPPPAPPADQAQEPAPEPSAWDEPVSMGGETRAFTKMSFDDFAAPAAEAAPEPPPPPAAAPEADSPFGAPPPPEEFSSETRAFPRMSLEELQRMEAGDPSPAPPAAPEPVAEAPAAASPWDEQEAPAFGGETRAFPKLDFDDFQQQPAAPAAPSWDAPAFSAEPSDDSPFGNDVEAPAFGGETRAFPKLNFDDFQQMTDAPQEEPETAPQAEASAPTEAASPWADVPAPQFDAPSFDAPQSFDAPVFQAPAFQAPAEEATPAAPLFEASASPFDESSSPFAPEPSMPAPFAAPEEEAAEPAADIPASFSDQPQAEDLPFAAATTAEPEAPAAEEPVWSLSEAALETAEAEAEPQEPAEPQEAAAPAALAPEAPPMPIAARGTGSGELTDEQVDRIARRVVELISDQVVRNIAWEVIPDLAEMVVKERIRQLEAEA
jgi:CheY-like chemotaxis protein